MASALHADAPSDVALSSESRYWELLYEANARRKYQTRCFQARFGVEPIVCAYLWLHYSLRTHLSDRTHLLWALEFLTCYPVMDHAAQGWGVCAKTYRTKVWQIIALLDELLDEVLI